MIPFEFTPQAAADLFEIWSYIAADSPEGADRVEAAVYEACALLSTSPLLGKTRGDLTTRPLRFWTVQRFTNYIIVYDPATSPLQVIRVLHGMRDLKRMLED
jgi:plasmid stabilization system protein ParE